jgi:hypothetical protein
MCGASPMTRRAARCLSAVMVFVSLTAMRAGAGADQLIGEWQQIESNSGKCAACRISIDDASSLAVTANNGWSANIVADEKGGVTGATGNGRWSPRVNKAFANKPFNIVFIVKGSRLYMTMFIDAADGSRTAVKSVYERVWIGS